MPTDQSLHRSRAGAGSVATPHLSRSGARSGRRRATLVSLRRPGPELVALLALAAVLDLWALSQNAWANEYYSAAVRSMSSSWHNFLFASLDPSGVMTVDKPPLALWVQALSARVFGFHPLSLLVPQALMGVASVALVYDLTRRRFGRGAGFVAGLVLALTPMTVAVSRHNNPDALLVLCCVAAVWFVVRALEDGRTRWLVLSGLCIGLGFETKMAVALLVVPALAAAYLWVAPRGRGRALRQLAAGGLAMVLAGGAWPGLVALTPASQRPWISGTSDNNIFSLIFGYNGFGRLDGQAGGPQALGGNGPFGGSAGPLRLLNASLGGQAGWLLGFAIAGGLAIAWSSRLRRSDARSGWLLAVGGSFAITAAVFSEAQGIFHPYYVSLLAPFTAALVGGGFAQLTSTPNWSRFLAPAAIVAGVVVEIAVLGDYSGQLTWLPAVLGAVAVATAVALGTMRERRRRVVALSVALAALLIAPAAWAFDTLGHATSGTFPAGGPQSASDGFGGPGGGPGRGFGGRRNFAGPPPGSAGFAGGAPPGITIGGAAPPLFGRGSGPNSAGLRPFGGGPFGRDSAAMSAIVRYVDAHGGGTIAVSSQSSAAGSIIASGARVAGIGGFSGRESDVGVSWFANEVAGGRIRWVLADSSGAGRGLPGDRRAGSSAVMTAVAQTCTSVPASAYSGSTSSPTGGRAALAGGLYDCSGRAAALAARA